MNSSIRLQYKKALIKDGIKVGGLSDEELTSKYKALTGEELLSVAPIVKKVEKVVKGEVIAKAEIIAIHKNVEKVEKVPLIDESAAVQLAQLIASLAPKQVEQFDEKTLVALIKKHSSNTVNVNIIFS
jgi:hypothetical protein